MTQSFVGTPKNDDDCVLRSVIPQPTQQPFVYTMRDAFEAFEWLRRQPGKHASVGLAEWNRLAGEVTRLDEENTRLRAKVHE